MLQDRYSAQQEMQRIIYQVEANISGGQRLALRNKEAVTNQWTFSHGPKPTTIRNYWENRLQLPQKTLLNLEGLSFKQPQ